MITKLRQASTIAFIAALLAACSTTPPSTHYLLTSRVDKIPTSQTPAVGVGPIEIPEYLNRNNVVYRDQDNELRIAQQTRWAEPLEDGISRVVTLNLAGLLNTENVRSFPWHPRRSPDFGIKIRVLRLDAIEAEAILVAEWVVLRPGEKGEVQRGISRHTQALDPQRPVPAQLPAAHSTLLYQFSEKLAAVISAAQSAS